MKKERKGFSVEFHTKDSVDNYTVWFEEKNHKVIFCYIHDFFIDKVFKSKAVCHNNDLFSKYDGRQIAFDRCIEKRFNYYNREIKNIQTHLETVRKQDILIEKRFQKFQSQP